MTEYGLRHADGWQHGIWFVDLAPVNDPALVAQTVADAIAAPTLDTDARGAVVAHLRERQAMLILDNCEQLVADVAAYVDDLLGQCPGVCVLVTSRQPLGLRGERIWRLSPLLSDDSAVELFFERAGLTDEQRLAARPAVVELCQVLDGLPLAIELAAARCDVLSPGEMLARLGRHQRLLRSSDPTLSARHRSLDDTIEWSHRLLTTDEQLAFRRLGLFAAGFGLEAATAVIADDAIDAYDVPELVWSLVSKSLVVSEPAAGSTRYRMLETIRAYARQQLDRVEETSGAAVRLGHYYLGAYGPQLHKIDVELLADRTREVDNLRALIPLVAPDDAEAAQALACAVAVNHRRASPRVGLDEGLRHLDRLAVSTPTRVALLVEVTRLAVDCGLVDVAADLVERAHLLAGEVGSPTWIEGQLDQQRGVVAIHRGEIDRARDIAIAALDSTSTAVGRLRLHNLLALVAIEQGAFDEARESEESALELSVQLGDLEAYESRSATSPRSSCALTSRRPPPAASSNA